MSVRKRNLRPDTVGVPTYNPQPLFAKVFSLLWAANANQACAKLDIHPAVLSRVLRKRLGLSGDIIIRIHEVTGMPVSEIKELAGLPSYPRYIEIGDAK